MKNSKKKKKKIKLIYKIIVATLFLVSILFIIGLMKLNILSLKWFMLVVGIILFIDFLFWLFIIKSKKKKISSFIAFIFISIISLVSFYLFRTTGLFTGMLSQYKTYNYSVVVLNNKYKKLNDIEDKTLGYLDNETEETQNSLEHIESKISPEFKEYIDVNTLVDDLLNNKVEAILIEDSYLSIVKEDNSELNSNVVTIYTFKVRVKIKDFSRDVNVTQDTFSIFVSGIDTYGEIDSVSRSDVNMVVTVNPKTKQILMTSIPRDYYVSLHGISGYKDKITHAGLYGIDMSVKTVEDLLDVEINYYVKVNFTSVIDIVDALDGVDVYSEYTFTSIDGYHYSKGYNAVNGEEALSFARERKAFSLGDNQRIRNQQALIQALIKKCISKEIIYKYNKLLDSLDGSFVTNMSADRITSLIRMQLEDMAIWTITSNSLKGVDSSNYTYSYPNQKLYVMEANLESVEEAQSLITAVYNGDTLENSYDENTGKSNIVTKYSSNTKKNNISSNNENKKEETPTIETSETDIKNKNEEQKDKDIANNIVEDESEDSKSNNNSQTTEDNNKENENLDDKKEEEKEDTTTEEENKNNESQEEDFVD